MASADVQPEATALPGSDGSEAEWLRSVVEREGREARNLVAWNVPAYQTTEENDVQDDNGGFVPVLRKRRAKQGSTKLAPRGRPLKVDRAKEGSSAKAGPSYTHKPLGKRHGHGFTGQNRESRLTKTRGQTSAIAPSGRGQPQRERKHGRNTDNTSQAEAQLWARLCDQLQRSVEELYQACEKDESKLKCQEVIMILRNCCHDFEQLVDRFDRQKAFYDSEKRPQSVAWEVRKMSPSPVSLPDGHFTNTSVLKSARQHEYHASPRGNVLSKTADKSKSSSSTRTQSDLKAIHEQSGRKSPANQIKKPDCSVGGNETEHDRNRAAAPKSMPQPALGQGGTTAVTQNVAESNVAKPDKGTTVTQTGAQLDVSLVRQLSWADRVRGNRDEGETVSRRFNRDKHVDISTVPQETNHLVLSANGTGGFEMKDEKVSGMKSNTRTVKVEEKTQEVAGKCFAEQGTNTDNSLTLGDQSDQDKKQRPSVSSSVASVAVETSQLLSASSLPKNVSSEGSFDDVEALEEDLTFLKPGKGFSLQFDDNHSLPSQSVRKSLSEAFDAVKSNGRSSAENDSEPRDEESFHGSDYLDDISHGDQIGAAENPEMCEEDESCTTSSLLNFSDEDLVKLGVICTEDSSPEPSDDGFEDSSQFQASDPPLSWTEIVEAYDARDRSSWGDRCVSPDVGLRSPGRAVQLHQKLSSPTRKRDLSKAIQISEEKQVKAQLQRDRLKEEQAQKLRSRTEKVREVREAKDELMRLKRKNLQEKLDQAEQRRMTHLQGIVRKAQEDGVKVEEIAFINTLEAENRKMEVLSRQQGHEARLNDLKEERQRRRDEQLAREEAVQEKRRQLEAARQSRLSEIHHHQLEQEARSVQKRQALEKARVEDVRVKARERERRLQAHSEARQLSAEELEQRISTKLSESEQRHAVHLQHRKRSTNNLRQLILQGEIFNSQPFTRPQMCKLCRVELMSEVYVVSHLLGNCHNGRLHAAVQEGKTTAEEMESFSSQCIVDLLGDSMDAQHAREKEEGGLALRKRARRLRQRLMKSSTEEVLCEQEIITVRSFPSGGRLNKVCKEMRRLAETATGMSGSHVFSDTEIRSIQHNTTELLTICQHGQLAEKMQLFLQQGGIMTSLTVFAQQFSMLTSSNEQRHSRMLKTLELVSNALHRLVWSLPTLCRFVLFHKMAVSWLELVCDKFKVLAESHQSSGQREHSSRPSSVNLTREQQELLNTLRLVVAALLQPVVALFATSSSFQDDAAKRRRIQLVHFGASLGTLHHVETVISHHMGPLLPLHSSTSLLQQTLMLLVTMAAAAFSGKSPFSGGVDEVSQQLMGSFSDSHGAGLLSFLYGQLLPAGKRRSLDNCAPLSAEEHSLICLALHALNRWAMLDLKRWQSALGAEGTSLELRLSASHLLWRCSLETGNDLLQETLVLLGLFTVQNTENQVTIQSSQSPTVLQQLCSLDFSYFSDPKLVELLFPTLVSLCYKNSSNVRVLSKQFSAIQLARFLKDWAAARTAKEASAKLCLCGSSLSIVALPVKLRLPIHLFDDMAAFLECPPVEE